MLVSFQELYQTNTVKPRYNTDTEGSIESVRVNGMSVLSELNKRKWKGFLSPGIKQTVLNNEVPVLSGCP